MGGCGVEGHAGYNRHARNATVPRAVGVETGQPPMIERTNHALD